jgi:hypothetical protein
MTKFNWEARLRPTAGGKKRAPADILRELWLYHTDVEIAVALNELFGLNLSKDSVTQKRQSLGLQKNRMGVPLVFSEAATPRFDNPPVVRADNVCVMSDVHTPFEDAAWCSAVLDVARRYGVKDCLIAGDLFDLHALNGFVPAMVADDGAEMLLTDELASAANFADTLLSTFERVTITLGNHEMRLAVRLGRLSISIFKALLGFSKDERVTVSEYGYALIIDSNGAKWRVTHPKNASVIPVRVAAALTAIHEQNVIAAHGHDWGEATGAGGRYAAACGMCGDPLRIEYAQKTDNTRPLMQQGAWFLLRGKPVLLHPRYRPTI